MKAIQFYETGSPDVLKWEDMDIPLPGPGEVRLRHTAIGVNMKEIGERRGDYPCPPLPTIPGIEGVAIITEIGEGVREFHTGDKVAYATMPSGSYCEERLLPADRLIPMPDDIDDKTVAACIHKAMTVRYLVKKTFPIRRGDTVLVHAAAGGTGLMLCQWAKHLGAIVIGTVSTEEKSEIAKGV